MHTINIFFLHHSFNCTYCIVQLSSVVIFFSKLCLKTDCATPTIPDTTTTPFSMIIAVSFIKPSPLFSYPHQPLKSTQYLIIPPKCKQYLIPVRAILCFINSIRSSSSSINKDESSNQVSSRIRELGPCLYKQTEKLENKSCW